MDKELIGGSIGSDGSYSVKLEGLKFILKGGYKAGVFGVDLDVSFGIKELLLVLKEKIPGKIDDALIDFIVAELDKPKVV